MAQDSKIEWCDDTGNLWHGCKEVHEGCDNCYARVMAHRWGRQLWGTDKPRMAIASIWDELKKFEALAVASGKMRRVFVGSMMDIFERPMPMINHKGEALLMDTGLMRKGFFGRIDKGDFNNLDFLLLTKRPSNINKIIPDRWKEEPPKNVMFGTSPVNPETFDKLVHQLRQVKGRRFLSVEPQLELIDKVDLSGIDWVIQGGESGPHKRPFNLDWAYRMRDLCAAQNVPYFFKQIDKVQPIPEDLMIRQFPPLP